jgi:hypothetical protein
MMSSPWFRAWFETAPLIGDVSSMTSCIPHLFAVLFLHASCNRRYPNTAVAKSNRTHGAAGFVARKSMSSSRGSTSESPHVQHYLGVRARFAGVAGALGWPDACVCRKLSANQRWSDTMRSASFMSGVNTVSSRSHMGDIPPLWRDLSCLMLGAALRTGSVTDQGSGSDRPWSLAHETRHQR